MKILDMLLRRKQTDAVTSNPNVDQPSIITSMSIVNNDLLEKLARKDPIAHRLTYIVAQDVVENWFDIVNEKGEILEELNKEAQKFSNTFGLMEILTEWLANSYWSGWSILIDWAKVRNFNPRKRFQTFHINNTEIIPDSLGDPDFYRITREMGTTYSILNVPHKAVFHLTTDKAGDNQWERDSHLKSVYFEVVVLSNMRYNTDRLFNRNSSGFPTISSDDEMEDQEISDWQQTFKYWNTLGGILLPNGRKLEFASDKGKLLDPNVYFKPLIESISAGTGYPSSILTGAPQGARASAQYDQTNYYKIVTGLQGKFTPSVRNFYIREKVLPDDGDWTIGWRHPSSKIEEEQKEKENTEISPTEVPGEPEKTEKPGDPSDPDPEEENPETKETGEGNL